MEKPQSSTLGMLTTRPGPIPRPDHANRLQKHLTLARWFEYVGDNRCSKFTPIYWGIAV